VTDVTHQEPLPHRRAQHEALRPLLGRSRRVHFVGIGGSGMSGLAEALIGLGYHVSGSDLRRSAVTDRLAALGADVAEGHAVKNLDLPDVVVVSAAVAAHNPEVVEALRLGIPVIPRSEMLAELMRLRQGIAVAGAHGKTTTTSMIAWVLERAGLDPTAVVGGRLRSYHGGNVRLGQGHLMVAEADESDGSFMRLSPTIVVLTNIDDEHLDHYGTVEALVDAFVAFADRVPFYGAVLLSADDARLAVARSRIGRRTITYGLASDADVRGDDVQIDRGLWSCTVHERTERHGVRELGRLRLQLPGRHNLQNALAAVALGLEVGVPFDIAADALVDFAGVERRFQRIGEAGGVTVIDDYAHHPSELSAVIEAARGTTEGRIVVVFQPHRYSRLSRLFGAFVRALALADEVLLTEVYAAGEAPVEGASAGALAAELALVRGAPVPVIATLQRVPAAVGRVARPGDTVLVLGAGSIGEICAPLVEELGRQAG